MKSLEELRALKAQMQGKMGIRDDDDAKVKVVVGMATCGIASGARPVLTALADEVNKRGLSGVAVEQSAASTAAEIFCRMEASFGSLDSKSCPITSISVSPASVG